MILRKKRHKAGCIFLVWEAATAGVRTDEVRCFFVTQQMLSRSVLALSGYWDGGVGAKWLAPLLCLSWQMSAALERKEFRTVSNRRVEAIHLVLWLFVKVNTNILGQGWRVPWEKEVGQIPFFGDCFFCTLITLQWSFLLLIVLSGNRIRVGRSCFLLFTTSRFCFIKLKGC